MVYLSMWMRRLQRQEGQGMAEYGLILALVAVVAILAMAALGPQLRQTFTNITNCLSKSGSGSC